MRTRILQLMAQKQLKEGRIISQATVAAESGITRQTINKWVSGDLHRFDEETITKLCEYFECALSDLLYIDFEKTG